MCSLLGSIVKNTSVIESTAVNVSNRSSHEKRMRSSRRRYLYCAAASVICASLLFAACLAGTCCWDRPASQHCEGYGDRKGWASVPGACAAPSPSVRPIRVGVVGYLMGQAGPLLNATADGVLYAAGEFNYTGGAYDMGANASRMMDVVIQHTADNTAAAAQIDTWMADEANTAVDVVGLLVSRDTIDAVAGPAARHGLMMLGPTSGDRADYLRPKPEAVLVCPSPDAELTALLNELMHTKAVRRVAIMTTAHVTFGNDMMPFMVNFVEESGMDLVYHFVADNATRPVLQQAAEARTLGIQALLMYGDVTSYTAVALAYIIPQLALNTVIVVPYLAAFVIVSALGLLPSTFSAGGRVMTSLYGPLYTDTRFEVVRSLHATIARGSNRTFFPTAVLAANPVLATFTVMGYIVGRVLVDVLRTVAPAPLTRASILNGTFSSRLIPADDVVLGPYSRQCNGQRRVGCACHSGARTVQLAIVTASLGLEPVRDPYQIPLDTCSPIGVNLRGPQRELLVGPGGMGEASVIGRAALVDFAAGASAGQNHATDSTLRDVVTHWENMSEVGVAERLASIRRDTVMTAAIGPIFVGALPLAAARAGNLSVLIDPVELTAPLYGGFAARIVYLQATLDQEIHALAAAFGAGGIAVVSAAADDAQRKGVGEAVQRSLFTFGFSTYRGLVEAASGGLAVALGAMTRAPGDAGSLLVHGMVTAADVQAVADLLTRAPTLRILLPFVHTRVLYPLLLAACPDRQRRARVVFATALPNWNAALRGATLIRGAQSALMASYWDRTAATGVAPSPQSLAGFIAERFVASVAARVPKKLTGASLLDMLYAVSVVVVDQDAFTAGPFSRAPCNSKAVGDGCESNVGPRTVYVRSLDDVTATTSEIAAAALAPASSALAFSSGAVSYKEAPGPEGINLFVVVLATVGSALVIAAILTVGVVWYCVGRDNAAAPKDPSVPFTVMFTDIQSSTTLWAEVPDAMAPALEAHHALVRKALRAHRGYEVKTIGDAFMIAFRSPDDAVACAVTIQHSLFRYPAFATSIDDTYNSLAMEGGDPRANDSKRLWRGLRVRIGIHTGNGDIQKDPVTGGYDYYGTVTNTAARVEAVGHGGQVLLSEATLQALAAPPTVTTRDATVRDEDAVECSTSSSWAGGCHVCDLRCVSLGKVELRGLSGPLSLYQLDTIPGRRFPPLRVDLDVFSNENVSDSGCRDGASFADATLDPSPILGPSPDAVTVNGVDGVAPEHVAASIAALLAVLRPAARLIELKRFSKLWNVRALPPPHIPAPLTLGIMRGDAAAANQLDALSNRLVAIAGKTLAVAVQESGHRHRSSLPGRGSRIPSAFGGSLGAFPGSEATSDRLSQSPKWSTQEGHSRRTTMSK